MRDDHDFQDDTWVGDFCQVLAQSPPPLAFIKNMSLIDYFLMDS
jgi:hypothetical protein